MTQQQNFETNENLHRADELYISYAAGTTKQFMKKRLDWVKRGLGEEARLLYSSKTIEAAYAIEEDGRILVLHFRGRRFKPTAYVRFESLDKARNWVHKRAQELEGMGFGEGKKQPENNLKVGDVLRASWGYEQTNIDYYLVTKMVGKTMVEIVEIGRKSEATDWMQGECVPDPKNIIGEPMRKRVDDVSVCVIDRVAWARKIEPLVVGGIKVYDPDNYSSYH